MIVSVADLLTVMTRATAAGTDEDHDAIHPDGRGAITIVGTTTGDGIDGETTVRATRAGGPETIVGETTTGAIDGAITGGVINVTVAIVLCDEFKIGIAGDKSSQSRDMNAGPG